jgi:glutamate-1-semialdehyde aminotransferase/spore coat polysaccharide biosynthesis protein SpsF (cytidylyltransferase family)
MELKNKNKILAIVQARYNSTRFPGKVLKKIGNKTILEIIIKRLSKSKKINKIIVACSNDNNDKKITNICKKLKISYFCGSENDVLSRFYYAAKKYDKYNIIRITADCPLIDYQIVDKLIKVFLEKKVDYASNTNPPTFPDGLDAEIFKFETLTKAHKEAKKKSEREHVTQFIINNNKFKKFNLLNNKDHSLIRLTVDEPEDLNVIKRIFKHFKKNKFFLLGDIMGLYKSKKKIFHENSHIVRNEGSELNQGQKIWKRAKKIIPGGTMLFSKNPDLFLPKFWPAYFKKSKGFNIWDLDGKKYADLSLMGVGTNILGYGRKEIDDEVRKVINSGNMTTLNCKEEIILAEKLVAMHPWSKMVRFARTGGEAAAIAVRIARAASGRDKIAVCGYHGWHDWYLSTNLSDSKNLNSHLMRNLPINGVQKNLKNTTFQFEYNNFQQLENIISNHRIGAVVMEVSRNQNPKNNFLEKVRLLTKNKNIILIFDECTSGFRETFGGLHLKYKINPEIALFGKALGNGYAINAIVGKDSVMNYANSTFISSTFWTERIGTVAAIKTLEIMEKIKSWEQISKNGKIIKNQWKYLAKKNKLDLKIEGLNAMPKFSFNSKEDLYYKTFISQEFLKKNILATNSIYLCINHDINIINKYCEILDEIFCKIKKSMSTKEGYKDILNGPVCLSGIRSNN